MKNSASLYLIPTPIGDRNADTSLPLHTIETIHQIKHFLVENIRTARRFLKSVQYPYDFEQVWFYEVHEHNQLEVNSEWLKPLLQGHNTGLMSEAGIPCVADPGHTVVRLAHEHQIRVVPLGGQSSIFMALMSSGLNGQQFTFHGYLPVKIEILRQELKKIEQAARKGYSQIFIETPYRNQRLLEVILTSCLQDTMLCIASGIDTKSQNIQTRSIHEWKTSAINLKGLPCVFILGI